MLTKLLHFSFQLYWLQFSAGSLFFIKRFIVLLDFFYFFIFIFILKKRASCSLWFSNIYYYCIFPIILWLPLRFDFWISLKFFLTESGDSSISAFSSEKSTVFQYYEVLDATSNFSASLKIGQGSYGSVYLGKLRGTVSTWCNFMFLFPSVKI